MVLTPSRRLWTFFEPIHAVTYFAPAARQGFEHAGYRGFWRGYFAGRAAPLGAVGAAPVVALFYGFAPGMVARALPSVWELAPPSSALAARGAGAVAALTEVFAGHVGPGYAESVVACVELMRGVVDGADRGGRPLGAANGELPWPDEPVAALWHAATVLRELRGDGHVAALLTAGVSGLEALVLRAGQDLDRGLLQPARGWTDDDWQTAVDALQRRSLVDSEGRLTPSGESLLDDVETVTDHLAAQPWQQLQPGELVRLADMLGPLARAAATLLPDRTPIGLPTAT